MLVVRLVLDLLARREPGAPVPLLVSLSSWSPGEEDLRGWLAAQVTVDHPALAAPVPAGAVGGSRAGALLARGLILPVLDGLDELPEMLWGIAIARINEALLPGEAVVVTSRSAAYRAASCPPHGAARLRGAAVVEIRPVDPATAAKYLVHDVGAADRWSSVLAALGTPSPLGRALSVPLMLSLAREIYTPVPGGRSGPARDPAELSGPALVSREMVEQHLLDAYIPAAYRRPPNRAGQRGRSWRAEEAERWLALLASHLERTTTSTSFAWWQLEQSIPRAVNRTAAAVVVVAGWGITFAVTAGSVAGISARLISGLAVGLTAGLVVWGIGRHPQNPMTGLGWSLRHTLRVARGLRMWRWRRPGQFVTLAVVTFPIGAILTAVIFGFAAEPAWLLVSLAPLGIHGVYGDLAAIAMPKALLARERRSYLLLGITASVYGTAAGFVLGTACGHAARALFGIAAGPFLGASAGIAFAVSFGLGLGIVGTAWSRFRVSNMLLASRRRLPWRLISFLDDAHGQGVLRQAGAVYQFRHLELQHRLAAGPAETWSTPPSPSSTCGPAGS